MRPIYIGACLIRLTWTVNHKSSDFSKLTKDPKISIAVLYACLALNELIHIMKHYHCISYIVSLVVTISIVVAAKTGDSTQMN